jgi:hypothetical protein
MKKITGIIAAVAVTAGMVVATAAPAQAYTYKQDKVWSFVKKEAPVGASIMGKRDTVNHAKETCSFLKSGFSYEELLDVTAQAIVETGLSDSDAELFIEWSVASDFAGVKYLCPSQWYKMDV